MRRRILLTVVLILIPAIPAAWTINEQYKRAKGQTILQTTMLEQKAKEQRITAWIVERNPEATIRDFADFPTTLLTESAKAGIDFRIVLAMIDKESQFNPRAVGSSGEIGLMQILPATGATVAKQSGREFKPPVKNKPGAPKAYADLGTLGDPKENITIGVAYLKQQVDRFGMSPIAIRAYNRNPDNAKQHRPWDRYAEDVGLRLVTLVHEFPR